MRLLMWASSYGQTIGGGPVLAPLLATSLVQRGHQVTVLTDRRPESLAADETGGGVRIHRPIFRRALLTGDLALISAIRRDIAAIKAELRPDVTLIFSSGYGEYFHYMTARDQNSPLVVCLHDLFPPERYRADTLIGRNLRAARWVTACSRSALMAARSHVPAIKPISSVIHNALPTLEFTGAMEDRLTQELVFLGRLIPQKGVDVLIAAMSLLADRFPSLHLTIAGKGEERPVLEADIARRNLGSRIAFAGTIDRDNIHRFLAQADIVVMPSRCEPFGLVALEAAQMARPVVASAVDGLPEIIIHDETGLLVEPGDPVALAQAIALLIDDPKRARTLGVAARARALTQFRWDRYVDAHERIFEAVCQ